MPIIINANQSIPAPLASELGGLKRIRKFVIQNSLEVSVAEEVVLRLARLGARFFVELAAKHEFAVFARVERGELIDFDFENVEFPRLLAPADEAEEIRGLDIRLHFGGCQFLIHNDDVSKMRDWIHVARMRIEHESKGLTRGITPSFLYSDILEGTGLSTPNDRSGIIRLSELERRTKQNSPKKLDETAINLCE